MLCSPTPAPHTHTHTHTLQPPSAICCPTPTPHPGQGIRKVSLQPPRHPSLPPPPQSLRALLLLTPLTAPSSAPLRSSPCSPRPFPTSSQPSWAQGRSAPGPIASSPIPQQPPVPTQTPSRRGPSQPSILSPSPVPVPLRCPVPLPGPAHNHPQHRRSRRGSDRTGPTAAHSLCGTAGPGSLGGAGSDGEGRQHRLPLGRHGRAAPRLRAERGGA